jgi:putative redox protein
MGELSATVRLVEGTTSVASSRAHSVVVDRQLEKGGRDLGFQGGELLLAGQGGCFLSNLVAAARARNIDLGRVTVHVTGASADAPARFSEIRVAVQFDDTSNVTAEEAEHLLSIAERSCIVTNTLKAATPVAVSRVSAGEVATS